MKMVYFMREVYAYFWDKRAAKCTSKDIECIIFLLSIANHDNYLYQKYLYMEACTKCSFVAIGLNHVLLLLTYQVHRCTCVCTLNM